MKITAHCEECKKTVKIKEIHYEGFCCVVYLKCGHEIYYVYAFKSKPDATNLSAMGNDAFEPVHVPKIIPHF